MNEFKGTKGRLAVKEAIGPRNELLYYYVQHKGNSIADFSPNPYTEIPTSLESAKANALIFTKAHEMLEMLKTIDQALDELWQKDDKNVLFDYLSGIDTKQLIKEATEI
ncbi:hypothetical protein ABE425_04630 [Chryseobacterium cucumeris]|uniref:hypothetical protein n=1 Tax=Chryseobacterium cucumeris TaxID=1813611 RepID=UPI00320A8F02